VENMLYMSASAPMTRHEATITSSGHKPGCRPGAGAKPRRHRAAAIAAEVQQVGITVKKAAPDITLVVALYSPIIPTTPCLQQLRHAPVAR